MGHVGSVWYKFGCFSEALSADDRRPNLCCSENLLFFSSCTDVKVGDPIPSVYDHRRSKTSRCFEVFSWSAYDLDLNRVVGFEAKCGRSPSDLVIFVGSFADCFLCRCVRG